ncbi:oligosaccharide flippase family protein [Pedobacter lithocola]|uniref:Oligosaccharide flippase family protein n=1 Tax=Pedobacter lithocola TaxID=1908239 RepID=A0ABV8P8J2_9SPHI
MKFSATIFKINESPVLKNSIWGLASSLTQNVLLSLFFVIVARNYSTFDFAQFLIANTLYQIKAAFSTLGLGQWFVREYLISENKKTLISKFLKIQFYSGNFFYLVNLALAYSIYDGNLVRELSIVLGINVVFDNIIFAIKSLNIADFEQQKTFRILLIDAILRFLIGVVLIFYPMPMMVLCLMIVIVRFATLYLFINIGVKHLVNFKTILKTKVSYLDLKILITNNWSFIVIGSISIIYWRIASIIISKLLTNTDVANYEISFKIFLLAQLVPLILSSSVFPSLVKLFEMPDKADFQAHYKKFYMIYLIFGLASFTFIFSFSGLLIPFAFGSTYTETSKYTVEMFLTMIVFPTFLLQANVLIAMKLEKLDMILNIIGIFMYLILTFIGFSYTKSLSVINYSIFISFVVLHIIQDIILLKSRIIDLKYSLIVYSSISSIVLLYIFLSNTINPYLLFSVFWLVIIIFSLSAKGIFKRNF